MEEQTIIKVAIDAMGGDFAPLEIVKGVVEATKKDSRVYPILVGDEGKIRKVLSTFSYDTNRISVLDAPEVISNDEAPVMAVRKKKNSSIVKAMELVKNKEADAVISAGNTGAVLVGAQLIIGRLKGVERPPLAPLIPTTKGVSLLIDCGANVDARATHLVQFAKMGSVYMESIVGVKNPRVAIVNIGAEEEKGNALVKETYPMLKNCNEINFIGNIEARDIPEGAADVIVCEAFVGNVILKLYEGLAGTLLSLVKKGMTRTIVSKIGALLVKPSLKKSLKTMNIKKHGGAPMLGLKGLVVKTHGSSKSDDVEMAILQCIAFKDQKINEKIKDSISVNEDD